MSAMQHSRKQIIKWLWIVAIKQVPLSIEHWMKSFISIQYRTLSNEHLVCMSVNALPAQLFDEGSVQKYVRIFKIWTMFRFLESQPTHPKIWTPLTKNIRTLVTEDMSSKLTYFLSHYDKLIDFHHGIFGLTCGNNYFFGVRIYLYSEIWTADFP